MRPALRHALCGVTAPWWCWPAWHAAATVERLRQLAVHNCPVRGHTMHACAGLEDLTQMLLFIGSLMCCMVRKALSCARGFWRTCGGLVQEKDAGLRHQGAGNCQPALLPAREAPHADAAWQQATHLRTRSGMLSTLSPGQDEGRAGEAGWCAGCTARTTDVVHAVHDSLAGCRLDVQGHPPAWISQPSRT